MARQKDEKTNVMRLLEQRKVAYTAHTYRDDGQSVPDGVKVARMLGQDLAGVFKTLVTEGTSGGHYVFCIPAAAILDMKKAAKAVGEKRMAMLPSRELLPLTGYVHGGCSPVGMKKPLPTMFHDSCLERDTICVSAGRIGFQVELAPKSLIALVDGTTADVIVEE